MLRVIYNKTANLLIKHGANLDARNHKGETPTYIASGWSNEEGLRLLITNGANLNLAEEEYRYTPLHIAVSYNNDLQIRV